MDHSPFISLPSLSSRCSQTGAGGQTALCNTKWPLQQATPGTGALQTSSSNVFLPDRPVLGPTNPWQMRSQISNGYSWVICLGTPRCESLVLGAGGQPYKSPNLVNSCRIQFTHSLRFCFQLKLDWNQVICQRTVNHCLATFADMRFHQQPRCSCAFLHDIARGFLTYAGPNKQQISLFFPPLSRQLRRS